MAEVTTKTKKSTLEEELAKANEMCRLAVEHLALINHQAEELSLDFTPLDQIDDTAKAARKEMKDKVDQAIERLCGARISFGHLQTELSMLTAAENTAGPNDQSYTNFAVASDAASADHLPTIKEYADMGGDESFAGIHTAFMAASFGRNSDSLLGESDDPAYNAICMDFWTAVGTLFDSGKIRLPEKFKQHLYDFRALQSRNPGFEMGVHAASDVVPLVGDARGSLGENLSLLKEKYEEASASYSAAIDSSNQDNIDTAHRNYSEAYAVLFAALEHHSSVLDSFRENVVLGSEGGSSVTHPVEPQVSNVTPPRQDKIDLLNKDENDRGLMGKIQDIGANPEIMPEPDETVSMHDASADAARADAAARREPFIENNLDDYALQKGNEAFRALSKAYKDAGTKLKDLRANASVTPGACDAAEATWIKSRIAYYAAILALYADKKICLNEYALAFFSESAKASEEEAALLSLHEAAAVVIQPADEAAFLSQEEPGFVPQTGDGAEHTEDHSYWDAFVGFLKGIKDLFVNGFKALWNKIRSHASDEQPGTVIPAPLDAANPGQVVAPHASTPAPTAPESSHENSHLPGAGGAADNDGEVAKEAARKLGGSSPF